MKIAIDGRVLNEQAGKAVYTRSVVAAMATVAPADQFEIYGYVPAEVESWPANIRFHPLTGGLGRLSAFRHLEADVLFSPSSYLTTLISNKPTLTTIHDLIAYKATVKLPLKTRLAERLLLGPAVRRSKALTVQNQATLDDLVSLFPAAAAKARIVRPGIAALIDQKTLPAANDQADYLQRLAVQRYLLFVGTLEPRKNLVRLIEAYEQLSVDLKSQYQLVLAGSPGWLDAALSRRLNNLPTGVILAGRVSDAELATLYANTSLVVYPSLYEGVGYPILEGFSYGKPVVTSNIGAMAEVGADAAVLVDPTSTVALTEAIVGVLSDPTLSATLSERGLAAARRYSWSETANQYLEILRAF